MNVRTLRPVVPRKLGLFVSRIFSTMNEEILLKQSKYSKAQMMGFLNQAESGVPVAELCREHGMRTAIFYKWRAKYGVMDASLISRMKALDKENK